MEKKSAKKRKELTNELVEKDEFVKKFQVEIAKKVKEKITKEIIDDIKNDVSAIVKEEVREDLKKEFEKEMKIENKRILRGKRGKIFRRDIVIIILLLIIGYLIYYMYNHNYVSFNINSNMNNTSLTNDKKTVQVENDYSYLIDKTNVKLPFDNVNSLYLYMDTYSEETINDSIKLTMSYNNLLKDSFTSLEMKQSYIALFGTDSHFKNTSFDYECKHFKYDNETDTYSVVSNNCINISSKEILEKIIKISKKDEVITITTVVGVYDKNLKTLYNYKNAFDPIATNLNNNFNITDYQDKLSTYKYTFTYDSGEYHFTKITKLD